MNERLDTMPPRWQDYILTDGQAFQEFWASHLRPRRRDVLFVLGHGFDPRMCLGLAAIMGAGGEGRRDICVLALEEGSHSPSQAHAGLAQQNWRELECLAARGTMTTRSIPLWSADKRRRVGATQAAAIFRSISDLASYTDIVVDVSALPRGVYFPLIGKILHLLDHQDPDPRPRGPNLHVVVSESPELDRQIRDEGVEDAADYVPYFQGGAEIQGDNDHPTVWIPLLGEGQQVQLKRISELVGTAEVCVVLPSPSLDPRRADNLVLEYQDFLFDQLRIEPRNIIFASEWNPFEVYRQIRKAILDYRVVLSPLGGCKPVLSALSTKLMSLGALLVAYELKQLDVGVAIAHVEAQGYLIHGPEIPTPYTRSKPYGLWLWGECYEPT